MRYTLCLLLAVISLHSATAQTGKKQISVDDLYKNNTFKVKNVPGFNAMKDGKRFTKIDEENGVQYIRVYDLATGKQLATLFNSAEDTYNGTKLKIDEYQFSQDEHKMLLL